MRSGICASNGAVVGFQGHGGTYESDRIECQVECVAELTSDGEVSEDRVHVLAVVGCGRGLDMLNVLSQPQGLSCQAELLLENLKGLDVGGLCIGAEEVPRVEAGEVLDGSEELVATDCMILSASSL